MSEQDHPATHSIVFTVDGETVNATSKTLTANTILALAGRDPAMHYLVEVHGREQVSYEGKGDEEIKVHQHQAFVSVATGPTPVSNVSAPTGVETFLFQLVGLGLEAEARDDFAMFTYTIPVGSRIGETIGVALQLPLDLPATPPPGPHIRPRLGHPGGSVLPSPLGPEWEYWSRPFPGWAQSARTAAAYMAHLRALFNQL